MNEIIFFIKEVPEGGYTARALGESVFTEGGTFDELKNNIKEAVDCHFDDDKKPKLTRLHNDKKLTFNCLS